MSPGLNWEATEAYRIADIYVRIECLSGAEFSAYDMVLLCNKLTEL